MVFFVAVIFFFPFRDSRGKTTRRFVRLRRTAIAVRPRVHEKNKNNNKRKKKKK